MSGPCCNALTVAVVICWLHLIHKFYLEIYIEKKLNFEVYLNMVLHTYTLFKE